MEQYIRENHYPEIVNNGQGMRRLELLGIDEMLATPETRRELFARTDDELYNHVTGYINSVTRRIPIAYDYPGIATPDGRITDFGREYSFTPPVEEQPRLMNLLFSTVRHIARDPSLDDRTALRRIGLAFGTTIPYLHPWPDGSGRTGRVFQYVADFGTEEGADVFERDMYALLAAGPIMSSKNLMLPIINQPNEVVDIALDSHARATVPNYTDLDYRERSVARIEIFLSVMRGELQLLTTRDCIIIHGSEASTERLTVPAGMDILAFHDMNGRLMSALYNKPTQEEEASPPGRPNAAIWVAGILKRFRRS